MPAYRTIPLLRPLIALLLGILAGFHFPYWNAALLWTVGITSIALLISFQFFSFIRKLHFFWIAGMALMVMFFLLGYLSVKRKDHTLAPNWIGRWENSNSLFSLVLNENPVPKPKSLLTNATVIGLEKEGRYLPVYGKVLLHMDTSIQNKCHLLAGDTICVQTILRPIQTYSNSSFDIATYYKHQQIYYQITATKSNLITFYTNKTKGILYFIQRSRFWILQQLHKHIFHPTSISLAEALLIGYKDDLDKGLMNAYRDAGIIHIIAISGIHLMLLYELLKYTCFFLIKNIRIRKYLQLLSLAAVWLFALLTGAGPSVVRAAVMLTFLVLGEIAYRNNKTLNGLVASAFLLLLVMPEWIWNVGFWLSYLAVLGIALFYQPFTQWPDFQHPLIRKIWAGIAITIAAQLLTLPVLMYCFGKIPVYFLFTNLLMIPLSSVVLYGLIGLLAISWMPFLANILGRCTDFLINLMNTFVLHVTQYPLASISVSIGFLQMLVLYGIIGVLFYLVKRKMEKSLFE